MKMSMMGVKPERTAPRDAEALNHRLLVQAAYVYQMMAGVYTYLPLGWRVIRKISQIIREEMDKIGTEMLMPSLSPKSLWETTGRLETVDVLMKTVAANAPARAKHDAEYILNCTHEDNITPIIMKYNPSYKDLPVAVYQIQSKFRNEPRAKSGVLRTREFIMKDMYSFHTSEEDRKDFYAKAIEAYWKVYERLGIKETTYITMASGGDFTKDYSHEFQTRLETGEDVLYRNLETGETFNKEVIPSDGENREKYESFRASEVGNIFPLGSKYTKAFGYEFADKDGTKKPVIMGSYGIGVSRLMGVIAEKLADEKGLVWPKAIAPFTIVLIPIGEIEETAQKWYGQLEEAGVEVLWDDRRESPGAKFADADLMGIPYRLVISEKSLAAGGGELKARKSSETKIVSIEKLIEQLKS